MAMNRMEHNSQRLFRTRLYRSVWRTDSSQWVAKIRLRWNWVSIDTFDRAKEAALARDRATFKLRDEKARLNYHELFVIENRAEPKPAPSSEIQLPPTAQQEDPDEDSALGWSQARGNDEVEAVGIGGKVRREAERAEAGLNFGCLRKGKRKVKTPGGEEGETRKIGVRIAIPLEDILQTKRMSLKDAAMNLNVSRSTLKRDCLEYGIQRWPPRKSLAIVDQEQISQSNFEVLLLIKPRLLLIQIV